MKLLIYFTQLLLCAEGTRVTAQKLEASQKFAQKAGLPILNYHLTPRTKGFIASLPHMRGRITDIYDMQLQFKSDDLIKPTLTNLLQGKQVTAYLSMSRIPLDEVPEDEKAAEEWLHKLYEKKVRFYLKLIKSATKLFVFSFFSSFFFS